MHFLVDSHSRCSAAQHIKTAWSRGQWLLRYCQISPFEKTEMNSVTPVQVIFSKGRKWGSGPRHHFIITLTLFASDRPLLKSSPLWTLQSRVLASFEGRGRIFASKPITPFWIGGKIYIAVIQNGAACKSTAVTKTAGIFLKPGISLPNNKGVIHEHAYRSNSPFGRYSFSALVQIFFYSY